jgi:hypothetical protein
MLSHEVRRSLLKELLPRKRDELTRCSVCGELLVTLDRKGALPRIFTEDERKQKIIEKPSIDSCLKIDPGEGPE